MRTTPIMIAAAVCVLGLTGKTTWCATYHVTHAADSDCSDNLCDLQSALIASAASSENDQINIAQGTYIGNYFYKPATGNNGDLVIVGGWNDDFSSRDSNPANTVLNGNHSGSVLALNPDIPSGTADVSGNLKVDGITVKNGKAYIGGGILALTHPPGSIEVTNSIIENNQAEDTGGGSATVVWMFGTTNGGNVTFTNNIVRNNSVLAAGGTDGSGGGCSFIVTGDTVITNNLVYNNSAGDADYNSADGGGMDFSLLAGRLYLINNTITDNQVTGTITSTATGGGISLGTHDSDAWAPTEVVISNSIIFNNTASTGIGDDIHNRVMSAGLTNGSSLSLENNDYHGYFQSTDAGTVDPAPNTNNIDEDPLFSSEAGTLYSLTNSSPCIDTGINSAVNMPTEDLAGMPRPQDGNNDGSSIADMGCYEFLFSQESRFSWTMFLPAIITKK